MIWIVSLGWLAAGSLSSPAQVFGDFEWVNRSLQSTGGITYFVHTTRVYNSDATVCSPVTQSGTNLSVTVSAIQAHDFWLDGYHYETNGTVLGNLSAGWYQLQIYKANSMGLILFDSMAWFPVPEPELTLILSRNGNTLHIDVRGVAAVSYTVQSSGDLTNWTNVQTNVGAPFTFSSDVSDAALNFYRAQAESGMVLGPAAPGGPIDPP